MIKWENLNTLTAYKELQETAKVDIKAELSSESGATRVKNYTVPVGAGLEFNYGACPVNDTILDRLLALAKEAQLSEKFEALYNGEVINTGEKRKVLHHLCRGQLGEKVVADGVVKREFYLEQLKKIKDIVHKVHTGEVTNAAGETFTTVVQIGIGGSDLGPRAIYLALENWAKANNCMKMKAEFISNVDPDDAAAVLNRIDIARSLFILVSKSGITLETLTNEMFVRDALSKKGFDASKHMITVTSETSPIAKSSDYLPAVFMDDYIGGRYSSCSGVGGVILSLAFGFDVFQRFLDGAAEADKLAKNSDMKNNAAMLDALTGVYEKKHSWLSQYGCIALFAGTFSFSGTLATVRYGVKW